jgi:hypothetical protein
MALAALVYEQSSTPLAPGTLRPDGAYQAGKGVPQPSLAFGISCEIPDLARKLWAQGEVSLSLVVRADGRVRVFKS